MKKSAEEYLREQLELLSEASKRKNLKIEQKVSLANEIHLLADCLSSEK